MIEFSCPKCGTVYHAEEAHVGRKIRCSHLKDGQECGETVHIPSTKQAPIYPAAPINEIRNQSATRSWASASTAQTASRFVFSADRKSRYALSIFAAVLVVVIVALGAMRHFWPRRPSLERPPAGFVPYTGHPIVSLPNGTELKRRRYLQGLGDLTVENGLPLDAAVTVFDLKTSKCIRSFYVRADMNYTERQIPVGSYDIYFSTGKDWNAANREFNLNASYSQFGKTVEYSEPYDEETGRTQFVHFEITLQPVPGGDVVSLPIDRDAFHRIMQDDNN